jgi:hypothetical protein
VGIGPWANGCNQARGDARGDARTPAQRQSARNQTRARGSGQIAASLDFGFVEIQYHSQRANSNASPSAPRRFAWRHLFLDTFRNIDYFRNIELQQTPAMLRSAQYVSATDTSIAVQVTPALGFIIFNVRDFPSRRAY